MTDVPSADPAADPAAPAPPPLDKQGSTSTFRELLAERDYVKFWIDRFAGTLGGQVQGVALGWQMYALGRETHDVGTSAFYVGMVGLAAFIPVLLLTLTRARSPTGTTGARCWSGALRARSSPWVC
jgi:hypothetical protein